MNGRLCNNYIDCNNDMVSYYNEVHYTDLKEKDYETRQRMVGKNRGGWIGGRWLFNK